MSSAGSPSPGGRLLDPRVRAVIEQARAQSRPADDVAQRAAGHGGLDPFEFTDYALPISPEQGDFLYLLCRAIAARRVAECASSHGVSTLYLAAAVRDNGGGVVSTFADLAGPVDLLLVDAWPTGGTPTLGRAVLELVAPALRPGAIVINDNREPDYLDYVCDPAHGFLTMSLPLKGLTEFSVRR